MLKPNHSKRRSQEQTPESDEPLYQGPQKLAPYPLHVSSPVIKPTDKRLIQGVALETMHKNAQQQIEMLRKQADLIMQQAKEIEERVQVSTLIYKADFRFEPVIGERYFLYKKESSYVLSPIAPEEWGRVCSYDLWLAEVELLGDKTWEVVRKDPDFKT